MLLSRQRTQIVAFYIIGLVALVLLLRATNHRFTHHLQITSNQLDELGNDNSWSQLLTLAPNWTTEQESLKFARAQYATNLDYLCNAVGFSGLFMLITNRCSL